MLIYTDDAVEVVDGKPRKVVEIVDDSARKVVGSPRKRPAEEVVVVDAVKEEVPSTPKKKKRRARPGRSSPDTANLRKLVKMPRVAVFFINV